MQIYDGREFFWQWDTGQKIILDDCQVGEQVHFYNIRQPTALVTLSYELDGKVVANVPNILLQHSDILVVYHYVDNGDSKFTKLEQRFNVKQRVKPDDYVYTEVELLRYSDLVKEIEDHIDDLAEVIAEHTKEEQEKTLTVTENGSYSVVPDENKVLSKVDFEVDVRDKELGEINALIDESGVLDNAEGTATEKVEELIEIIEENTLPDWDDDSPIIASGEGYPINAPKTWWDLTEKGTLRWHSRDANSIASVGSIIFKTLPDDYRAICEKIRQIDFEEGVREAYAVYAPFCERVRLPASVTRWHSYGMLSIKEVDMLQTSITQLDEQMFSTQGTVTELTLPETCETVAYKCFADSPIKKINLGNVKNFNISCFQNCYYLEGSITFSKELIKIWQNAFKDSFIEAVKFQQPTTDSLPTIASSAFEGCSRLTNLSVYEGWNQSLYLQSADLTQECLHDSIEKFADMSMSDTTMIFNVGTKNIEKIDAEHIAMLDAKCISYS